MSGLPINHRLLTATAFSILTADLKSHGNTLSPMHGAALLELVDTMASYTSGEASGRKAFALPTGMGKTSAVVAFITALDRLGYEVPVSVAASKVSAQRGAAAIGIKNGQDQATLEANARRQQTEIGFSDFASLNKANASLAAIKPVTGPSMLEAGLTIASAGVTYGTTMNKIKNAKGGS